MLAHVIIVVLGGSAVAFLVRFEIALFRELRGTPKQWQMVSRLRLDQPRSDEQSPIFLTFTPHAGNIRVREKKVGR